MRGARTWRPGGSTLDIESPSSDVPEAIEQCTANCQTPTCRVEPRRDSRSLTRMDSRIDSLRMLGPGPGDAVCRVIVVPRNDCRMTAEREDEVHLCHRCDRRCGPSYPFKDATCCGVR